MAAASRENSVSMLEKTRASEKWMDLFVLTMNVKWILPECGAEGARRKKSHSAHYQKLQWNKPCLWLHYFFLKKSNYIPDSIECVRVSSTRTLYSWILMMVLCNLKVQGHGSNALL